MRTKIFVKEKIYIPENLITKLELLKKWEHHVFDESLCRTCDNRFYRLNEQCKPCKGYVKTIKLWNKISGKDGKAYYTFPPGDIKRTLNKLNIDSYYLDIEDHRCTMKFSTNLKFTSELYEGNLVNGMPTCNQKHLVKAWMHTKSGIILAQPRSGKCLVKSTVIKTSAGIYLLDDLVEKNLKEKQEILISTHSGMKKISAFHKKESSTIKIKTSCGYEIEGTPEHPVLVQKQNGYLEWRELKDIKINDRVSIYASDEEWLVKDFKGGQQENIPIDSLENNKNFIFKLDQGNLCYYLNRYLQNKIKDLKQRILIKTYSEGDAKLLQILFTYFGIISKRKEKNIKGVFYLEINSKSVSSFRRKFKETFYLNPTTEAFQVCYESVKGPVDNLFLDKIVAIEIKPEIVPVYDLTVPEGHNFVANGIIVHNTVMGSYISCELSVKTLIIAHQEDLLNNFYKTYENMTNLKEVREQTGKEVVKIIKDIEDLEQDLDVAMINYQKFIRKETGADRIEAYLKGRFGLIILDECFPAATQILLSGGIYESIASLYERFQKTEAIFVACFNETTEALELKKVTKVFKQPREKTLITLYHRYGTLTCTSDHRLLTKNKEWLEAKHCLGERLLFIRGQEDCLEDIQVRKIEIAEIQESYVYDLEVEDNHNYFADNILAHNCHAGNAAAYGKFLSGLDARYRLGLTATPKRKDCVSGNTKIVTDKGELSMFEIIKKLKQGEQIKAASLNTNTNQIEFQPILRFHEAQKDQVLELTFANNEKLQITLDHEFLNLETNNYSKLI